MPDETLPRTPIHPQVPLLKAGNLSVCPVSFRDACAFVSRHHRHHPPPQGHKFSVGVSFDAKLVGVVIVGRPVSRHLDDGLTLEVTRCCTDGTANACSKLYGAARRVTLAMGYHRLVTYTLQEEAGISLKAAGWEVTAVRPGGSWDSPTRPRATKAPTTPKLRWEPMTLTPW